METLTRDDVISRLTGSALFDLSAIASSPCAIASGELASWPVPKLSADGGCSLAGKFEEEPFPVHLALVHSGMTPESASRRLGALRNVCAEIARVTGAEWVGVYERVSPVEASVKWGGSATHASLMKLAYVGAPSRPFFPLTPEFAASSNNSTVGLTGKCIIYHDVRALPKDAPYYTCDGKVRAEVCAPIIDGNGAVIGIIDVESFTPDVFRDAGKLSVVLAACAALGAADLLRDPPPASAAEDVAMGPASSTSDLPAWRQGLSDADITDGLNAIQSSIAAAQPLIGAEEPVSVLIGEYEDNLAFLPKIVDLTEKFRFLRRCRGDGNCFYRAVIVSLGIALVRSGVRPAGTGGASPLPAQIFYEALLTRVHGAKEALSLLGYQDFTTEDFFTALHAFLVNLSGGFGDVEARVETQVLAPMRLENQNIVSTYILA